MRTNDSTAKRELAAQPAPNPMGQDRFKIIERVLVQGIDPDKPPQLMMIRQSAWQAF